MKNLARFVIPLMVILTMLLAACGAPAAAPTEAPATQAGGGATADCPAGVQGKSIEMWSPFTGGDGDEMTALAERFSSENPCDITVTHVAQPEYVQKLEAGAAAGQLPAMTAVHATRVAQLAARGVLKPFGPEAMAVLGEDLTGDFPEDLWSAGEYKGERYAIPLDVHPLMLFYNKELFEQAGIEPPGAEPWTNAEFEDALAKLEAIDVTPLAMGTNFEAETLWVALLRQYGGSLTDAEGTTATYNSEAGVRALEKVKELHDTYTPDISGTGDPEVNLFKQGNVGMVFHGPWWISDLSKLDFVGFAPLPTLGDQPATWGGSHQLAL
ncbi:MAG TPA: extracellular solute-binding protein, partial [Anaerolineales bacterium]|nr:extracellular solute-binding protein [Anaerolineales bacterium]